MASKADFGVITMENEKKAFVRTLCTISATMASISFVGIGIIILIYYQTKEAVWQVTAYGGILSVSCFALSTVYGLYQLYPKKKRKFDETIHMLTLAFFILGLLFFAMMMFSLISAFRPWYF